MKKSSVYSMPILIAVILIVVIFTGCKQGDGCQPNNPQYASVLPTPEPTAVPTPTPEPTPVPTAYACSNFYTES